MALHFVGVNHPARTKDARYDNAARVFGPPDFVHRRWDVRAWQEIAPGDVVVFATGTAADELKINAFDDSAVM
jgi:hypothetical protein